MSLETTAALVPLLLSWLLSANILERNQQAVLRGLREFCLSEFVFHGLRCGERIVGIIGGVWMRRLGGEYRWSDRCELGLMLQEWRADGTKMRGTGAKCLFGEKKRRI